MNNDDQTRGVGYRRPPKGKQFSKDNQPPNRGRPKGSISLSNRIQRLLSGDEKLPAAVVKEIKKACGGNKSALDAILLAGLKQAIWGNPKWAKILLENGWGKPEQVSKLVGPDGEALGPLVQVYLPDNGRKG